MTTCEHPTAEGKVCGEPAGVVNGGFDVFCAKHIPATGQTDAAIRLVSAVEQGLHLVFGSFLLVGRPGSPSAPREATDTKCATVLWLARLQETHGGATAAQLTEVEDWIEYRVPVKVAARARELFAAAA